MRNCDRPWSGNQKALPSRPCVCCSTIRLPQNAAAGASVVGGNGAPACRPFRLGRLSAATRSTDAITRHRYADLPRAGTARIKPIRAALLGLNGSREKHSQYTQIPQFHGFFCPVSLLRPNLIRIGNLDRLGTRRSGSSTVNISEAAHLSGYLGHAQTKAAAPGRGSS
jgi:hypothetical protein